MKDDGIHLEGIIQKATSEAFTDEQLDALMDAFIDFIEERDLLFGGGVKLVDADQESSTD